MRWGVKNGDLSGLLNMNSNTVYEAKNQNPIDYTNKTDENNPNIFEMENTVLQDSVGIDVMLPKSILHQYSNMKYNN